MQEKKNQKKESFRFGKQKAAVTEKTDRRAGHLQAKNEKDVYKRQVSRRTRCSGS